MSSPVIKLENLKCGYGDRLVLDNAAFEVKKGEIVSLIGPNGCGKTTLIKTLGLIIPKLGGDIYLNDKKIETYTDSQRAKTVAILLTDRVMEEGCNCEEVVSMGRYPYTGRFGILSKSDKEIVLESMELCNVQELKDEDFSKISDGQKQRVLLARAIAQKPDIMILDEPTSFLDVKYKLEFLDTLKKLAKNTPFAVIASLHELDLAYQVSDKIVAIKENLVDKIGTPQEVYADGYIDILFGIKNGHFDEKNLKTVLK